MQYMERLLRATPVFGILGAFIISIGIIISAATYQGRAGEGYSFLNHFVSELGEIAHSELALAFNLGLFVGGIFLLVFLLGLSFYIGGWFGWVLGLMGTVTSISGALVGIFPMDNLEPHFRVAMTFFYMGLMITIVFSVYVLFLDRRNLFNRWLSVPGLLSAAAFFYFLFMTDPIVPEESPIEGLFRALENRPNIWETAVFEWVVVFTILGWILSLSIYLRAKRANLPESIDKSLDGNQLQRRN
jgi:hypothetical membrane protein